MTNSNYSDALNSGKVVVYQTYTNRRNPKQTTVQFCQLITKPASGSSNELISFAQGSDSDFSKRRLYANFSFANEVAEANGLKAGQHFKNLDKGVIASSIFGKEVNIALVENTHKNPASTTQTPKQPGANSGEVICLGDSPVYQHTALVAGTPNASSISNMTPDEQCTELDGRFFLTGAVTQRKPQSDFPAIFNVSAEGLNVAQAAPEANF